MVKDDLDHVKVEFTETILSFFMSKRLNSVWIRIRNIYSIPDPTWQKNSGTATLATSLFCHHLLSHHLTIFFVSVSISKLLLLRTVDTCVPRTDEWVPVDGGARIKNLQ